MNRKSAPGAAHHRCSYCQGGMRISALTCEECGLSLSGEFFTPRLYRLEAEDQRFIEAFVIASGSLKQMAELLQVSYPTVRNRLDRLIEKLEDEQHKDAQRKERILEDIEAGRLSARQGMRMIDAI